MPSFVYCLNTSTIQPASLIEKVEIAAQAGYQAIELWHAEVDVYCQNGGTLKDLKHRLADRGLQLPSMIYLKGWFETQGAEFDEAWAECRRRMRQAAELGSGICVAGPPLGPVNLEQGIARYRRLLQLGRELGVRPSLEFLGFADEFHTLEIAARVALAVDDPDASVVVDPFHLYRGGSGIEALAHVGLTGAQLGILHFNDAPANPPREQQHDRDRVLPGDGCLPLVRYLQLARDLGYQGALSLELFNPQLWEQDLLSVAQRGLEKMQAVVAQLP